MLIAKILVLTPCLHHCHAAPANQGLTRHTKNFLAGVLSEVGANLCRTEFGHPCSKSNAPAKCEKWHSRCLKPGRSRLHPEIQSSKGIWKTSCDAQVDLFASADTTHCHLWFSEHDQDSPLGQDAFAHYWLDLLLYAFSPVPLIHALLDRVQREKHCILLVALRWPSLAWFPLLLSLHTPLETSPWKDLLSQMGGQVRTLGRNFYNCNCGHRVSSCTSHVRLSFT